MPQLFEINSTGLSHWALLSQPTRIFLTKAPHHQQIKDFKKTMASGEQNRRVKIKNESIKNKSIPFWDIRYFF